MCFLQTENAPQITTTQLSNSGNILVAIFGLLDDSWRFESDLDLPNLCSSGNVLLRVVRWIRAETLGACVNNDMPCC